MKITAISDLHGERPGLPGGDLLILAGDYTGLDTMKEWMGFFYWLEEQQYRKFIYIGGNHDNFLENSLSDQEYADMGLNESLGPLSEKLIYLKDSGCEFEGLKIWGSPWSLFFDGINGYCRAFTGNEDLLREKYALIPEDIDLLITHTPPRCILDQNKHGSNCGSWALREALQRVKPQVNIFGHIHEFGGYSCLLKHEGPNTICLNVSYIDGDYIARNTPIRELEYHPERTCKWMTP